MEEELLLAVSSNLHIPLIAYDAFTLVMCSAETRWYLVSNLSLNDSLLPSSTVAQSQ